MESGIIDLPKIEDFRGNLSFIEEGNPLPFSIKRVYWIYDIPGGALRGGHAFREQHEMIIALSGSFIVSVDNRTGKRNYFLNKPWQGLYLPPGHWREMKDFATNSLALVLSSMPYSPSDYIYNYSEYLSCGE